MKKQHYLWLVVAAALLFVIFFSETENAIVVQNAFEGFFHGLTFLLCWIASLFFPNVDVYVSGNGWAYFLLFLFGAALFLVIIGFVFVVYFFPDYFKEEENKTSPAKKRLKEWFEKVKKKNADK